MPAGFDAGTDNARTKQLVFDEYDQSKMRNNEPKM